MYTGDGGEAFLQNRLRQLRSQHGMTQEKLAELVGVSRQTIISIESGRYDPSLELAFKISRVFALPLEKIFIYGEERG
ncbi:MAG: helix-turn-helix transcriptional regulator [Betaproteobacteria bacterium]